MAKLIIDVREPAEYESSHVVGAINLSPSKFMGDLAEFKNIPKDTEIILYCRTGSRSNVAMHILREHGYTNLTNGINEAQVLARFI